MIEDQEIQEIISICDFDIQILLGKVNKLRGIMEKKSSLGNRF